MPTSSFSEALQIRYMEDMDANPIEPCEIFLVGSFPGRSSPSGRFVLPRVLALNSCGIDRAGALRKIEELCHDVQELDLGDNELYDLNEIENILNHMPNLSFLNLSHNSMKDSPTEQLTRRGNIRRLVLNHTHIPWTIVSNFLDAMPNIHELHLSLNDYTFVDLPSNKLYPNVRQLFLCGNPIASWQDIMLLGTIFPQLGTLVLADSHLASVAEPSSWKHLFPHLSTINLNNALFGDWRDIMRLNYFQKLEDLRLSGIPLLDPLSSKLERRQHLIAYLPSVFRLNGSAITPKEREDAERAFIRHFLSEDQRPERFYELEAIHGKLDPLVDIDLSPKKTAQVMVNFCEERAALTVNLQQSVQELKVILSGKFGLRPGKMRLFYIDQEMKECGPDELRLTGRKLYNYQIKDGDEFLIYSK